MKKYVSQACWIILLSCLSFARSWSQTDTTEVTAKNGLVLQALLGVKFGGSMPFSLPAEIRKIHQYSPAVPFFIGIQTTYPISKRWRVMTGLMAEGKGMRTEAYVKGYKTSLSAQSNAGQEIAGYYYGDILTKVANIYLVIPLQFQYNIDKLSLMGGGYLGFAVQKKFGGTALLGYLRDEVPTGEKIGVSMAAYNFDKNIRTLDAGLSLGIAYRLQPKVSVLAQAEVGLSSIFKGSFESITYPMHNVFFNVGIAYRL